MTDSGNSEALLPSLHAIFDRQKSAFARYSPLSLDKRREALSSLFQSVVNHQNELIQAVSADLAIAPWRKLVSSSSFP